MLVIKPDEGTTLTLNCIHTSVNKFSEYRKQNQLPYKYIKSSIFS